MSEVVSALGGMEMVEELAAEIPQAVDDSFIRAADRPFELRKLGFDGIEVRTVGRQLDHFCMLDRKKTVMCYRTSAVEYLFGVARKS